MKTKREAVTDAVVSLAKTLGDPQPGLSVWHSMCERGYQEVLAAAALPEDPAPITVGSIWRWGYKDDFALEVLRVRDGFVTYEYIDPAKGAHRAPIEAFRESNTFVSDGVSK
ncbi:MAG: hypothetical protein V4739_17470 [Pseudomonadota bacterium]